MMPTYAYCLLSTLPSDRFVRQKRGRRFHLLLSKRRYLLPDFLYNVYPAQTRKVKET
jgi:hypothetical protein